MSLTRRTKSVSLAPHPLQDSHELARLYALRARHDAEDALVGLYHSRYRGNGLELTELREYQPGDNERAVHWPLSLRKGKMLCKVFQEERSTELMLLFDASPSLRLYTATWHCAMRSAALLAACALGCQDAVGAVLLTQNASRNIPPARGQRHLSRLLWALDQVENGDNYADPLTLGEAMDQLRTRSKHHTRVVVISDLLDDSYTTPLRSLAQHHDLLVCQIMEQTPILPPDCACGCLRDAKTGQATYVPSANHVWRKNAVAANQDFLAKNAAAAQAAGADYLLLPPTKDPLPTLCQHFATKALPRQ